MSAGTDSSRSVAWPTAARLIGRWLERGERLDALLESIPPQLAGAERARCQHLVYGVVRHFGRLESALERLVSHPPRFTTRGALFVAGFELIDARDKLVADGIVAKIVHHAVEQTKTLSSPAEARLVNAVVRKLAVVLASPAPAVTASPEELAAYFSHPEWLVRAWIAQFGPDATRSLLEWNQQPAQAHARWRATGVAPPEILQPTKWAGFFEVESGQWSKIEPLLKAGKLYLQDPGTRLSVELLAPQPGETVLDLCAAPGGKSLMMADAMRARATAPGSAGRIVAMDLPQDEGKSGARLDRLKENLARVEGVDVALVQADVENAIPALRAHQLPEAYPAVLIDVPCSNTGVMRHRADVKWRLQEGDFKKHPKQQLAMLHAAARLVAPGGRLVYSTCSIDREENEAVVKEFFNSRAGGPFKLEASALSFPWVTGHDGAAAFLLRRQG